MQYLTISILLLILFSTSAVAQNIENLNVFEGEWAGELEYANFADDRRVKLNARLSVESAEDGKSADLRYFYDDFGKVYRSKNKFEIDTNAKTWRYDGKNVPYRNTSDGLIAEGTVVENNKTVPLRLTIKVAKDSFTILKETRAPYKFRNKYTFTRSDVDTEPFPWIPAKLLKEDVSVLRKTLEGLHPGLYRYITKDELDKSFEKFSASIKKPMRQDVFMARVAEFLYQLKCYHTYVNPFNQVQSIKNKIKKKRTYIPFYFDIVDDRLIITANASSKSLAIGSEITSINDVPSKKIIEKLLSLSHADGDNNRGNRLTTISLGSGNGSTWSLFDVYFPIFFGRNDGTFKFEAIDFKTKNKETFEVFAFTQAERTAEMNKRYGDQSSYDAGWEAKVVDGIGYLRMANFITWKLSFKAKEFVNEAFNKFRAEKVKNVVIDIRGNGGGDSRIALEVGKNLTDQKLPCKSGSRTLIRSAKPDPELLKYTSTYDPLIKAAITNGLPKQAYKESDIPGLLEYLPDSKPCKEIEPYANPLKAKAFLIVDANNSSAAYSFAYFTKKLGIATLVGQQTGGNLRGFHGGSYLFTKLPNSEVEFDIPVFGYYSLTEQEDRGVKPDVLVERKPEDIGNGFDREFNVIKKMIEK